MTAIAYELLARLDAKRARSSSGFGPSGFFAPCERATVLALMGHPKVQETDKWAAIRGTAIHVAYAEARCLDVGVCEVPVKFNGIQGTCDYLDVSYVQRGRTVGLVEDLKTKTMKGIKWIRDNGVPRDHRAQISWYAMAAGVQRCRLVYAPVDGGRDDWLEYEFDRDEDLVAEALEWYAEMQAMAATGELPYPQKDPATWCAKYCEFYDSTGTDGCAGKTEKASAYVAPPWEDSDTTREVTLAASVYLEAKAAEEMAKEAKDRAREQLLGVRGVFEQFIVSWSNPAPRDVIDKDAAVQALVELGHVVPTVCKTASPAIQVREI